MVCSFLHGVNASKLALGINFLGGIVVIASALPMIHYFGLDGSCLALVGASAVRLAAAGLVLLGVVSGEGPSRR